MEIIKKRVKKIAFGLSVLLLTQSCVVYHKTPTTLEQACKSRMKTKITNANGATIKYQYIDYIDGVYYGVNKKSGTLLRNPLKQEEVTVMLKNQTATDWTELAIMGGSVLILVASAGLYIDKYGVF
ncbi:MAG: hypothetical protein WBN56_14665 [Robiginitalea sp.]|uniref:hypothetical protein n=1 Tax=Robiginitalea sp. TaxID=1902411 RepID=UPI003C7508A7